MGKRLFEIEIRGKLLLELDDAVIQAVDDSWLEALYDIRTPEEIADMIARCMIKNGWDLDDMDGWADQPRGNARIVDWVDWDTDESDVKERR